jgi:peptide-methionine (S)-S-oxide reductase
MKGIFLAILIPLIGQCTMPHSQNQRLTDMAPTNSLNKVTDTATFGAGCFWCTEAVFSQLEGVISVMPGYSGGKTRNPSYREVCSGLTGHAEVAQIVFDPSKISFEELLEVFWEVHDPTSLNRQGADQGSQYRSVIFYRNEGQRIAASLQKEKLDKSGIFDEPIVTEISPATAFFPAEDYHNDYYYNNMSAPYCQVVIAPKVEKVRKLFIERLKK